MTISKSFSLLIIMLCAFHIGAQNKISLRYVRLGGDGFGAMPGYELLYNRSITNGLSIRLSYTQTSSKTSLNKELRDSQSQQIIRNNFLLSTNTSDDPIVSFTNYKSYNLGVSKVINSSTRSNISIYLGARYEFFNKLYFTSTGSQVDFFSTNSAHERKLTYEIELSYSYRISQSVGVGSSFYYSANFLIFAGTIGGSVYF